MHFGRVMQVYPAIKRLFSASSMDASDPVSRIRYIGLITPMGCGGCPYPASTEASRFTRGEVSAPPPTRPSGNGRWSVPPVRAKGKGCAHTPPTPRGQGEDAGEVERSARSGAKDPQSPESRKETTRGTAWPMGNVCPSRSVGRQEPPDLIAAQHGMGHLGAQAKLVY
jgi:hypothetical protein